MPVERIPEHLESITITKDALHRLALAEDVLRCDEATIPSHLSDGGCDAAVWLLGVIAKGPVSPLIQAVASDGEQRRRVRLAASDIREVMNAPFLEAWSFLKAIFDMKASVSTGITILDSPIAKVASHLTRLRNETASLDEWLKFSRWQKEMNEFGFGPVVDELVAGRFEPQEASNVVAVRFYR